MNPEKAPAEGEMSIGGGSKSNMVPLPLDFIPGNFDVLCGRGKKNYNSLGNQRLRRIVDSYVEQYSAASSRQDKSDILSAIVNEVRAASPSGGFIKQDPVTERWFEVGDFLAREKVSQAFRDALSFQYRSSKKFKHEKRRQRDKAAKLAKQKGQAKTEGEEESKSPSPAKSKATKEGGEGKPLLQKKQSLTVLREEPPMAAHVPMLSQGNTQPSRNRAMSAAAQSSASFAQGMNRQDFGSAEQAQVAGQFLAFNNPGIHGDPSMVVTRHTSWPQLFPSAASNPLFNPRQAGMNAAQMAAMSQRRFSDAMMTDMNQAPFHQFHHSDPNPQSWSQHLQQEMNPMLQANAQAALHASFPSGMGIHPGAAASLAMQSAAGMMSTSGMPPLGNMANSPMGSGVSPMRLPDPEGRRKGPLERSASNVSTTSATAIVAHLESSLSNLDQDENPFEPVPLPNEEGDEEATTEEKGDDTMMTGW